MTTSIANGTIFNTKLFFRPFAKALITKAALRPGDSVLDAGCGQGYFSSLFAELGLKPLGVDISSEAIRSANAQYGATGARFEVGDVGSLHYHREFDSVFVRGCSIYNSLEFEHGRQITDVLLGYLKPGGVLIFDYYTNLCPRKKSETWIYHSVSSVKRHFAAYDRASVYFSLWIDTLLFGRFAISDLSTRINMLLSRYTGLGGDIVSFVGAK